MSIPRRLGRIARGFVSNLQEDERFRETLRASRERGEALRGAFEAALRGASEEWRAARESASRGNPDGWRTRDSSTTFAPPTRYRPDDLAAYNRHGLMPGTPIDAVAKKRRELIKRYHPDRFSDPEKRARAERVTAEINAAHDRIERHLRR